jgi:CO/xanthine dehydrogenase FAD-binding subunit
MHLPDIRLHEPRTIAEACELLDRYCDVSRIIAGGTDLLVDLKQGRVTGIEHLVSIRNIPGLGDIEETPDGIKIGALVTLNRASRSEIIRRFFPVMIDTLGVMAAPPVRNIATVAGNIAGAVPSSDLAPVFIVAGGEAQLSTGGSERRVRVEEYILGPRETVCGEREILTHLLIPPPPPFTGMSYRKFMLREANALAVAGVAARITLSGGPAGSIAESRIAMTAVGPKPQIAHNACALLGGKSPSERLFREAAAAARGECRPITDVRGSAEYRCHLVEVLTYRALEEAAARAREKEG